MTYKIEIKGLVQGVGFRPFIYRLAKAYHLQGYVINTNEGVNIKIVQSPESRVHRPQEKVSPLLKVKPLSFSIQNFINAIREQAPPASRIESINFSKVSNFGKVAFNDFQILKSTDSSDEITEISPDIAVCSECLNDIRYNSKFKIQNRKYHYPFINCTNCGPRFSIIEDLPYDRDKTTMRKFVMCDDCKKEYTDVSDRRFHAQPVACLNCGPEYNLLDIRQLDIRQLDIRQLDKNLISKNLKSSNINDLIRDTRYALLNGKIIAFKGIGGFHLACDATNNKTVEKLRELKSREGKPFAVMFSDINTLKEYAEVNEAEEKLLTSWRRPIVLLKQKKEAKLLPDRGGKSLASSINKGLNTLGVMLPYMPFHHLLFDRQSDIRQKSNNLKSKNLFAIVLTSGNVSDEPIVINNDIAVDKLSKIADAILVYNRDISNRSDDSVLFVANAQERLIRRSRGYVPNPVPLKLNVDGILATGGELKNCFCIGKANHAIMSQHIGDIKNPETLEFYTETINKFKKLFRFEPSLVVCDKHPDYLSTKFAQELVQNRQLDIRQLDIRQKSNNLKSNNLKSNNLKSNNLKSNNLNSKIKLLQVQHHYAHIASVMAEHNLDEKVIGVSFDGTGLGDDGNIWGSEFFVCDLNEYRRYAHFDYLPMPGGDKASEEPWRMAVSYLYKVYGKDFLKLNIPFTENFSKVSNFGKVAITIEDISLMLAAIDKKINCPLTSGAGRLFDAVSAIINLCTISTFEAEAPIRLESIIDESCNDNYGYHIGNSIYSPQSTVHSPQSIVCFDDTIKDIISDLKAKIPLSIISAKFHNTIILIIFDVIKRIHSETGINKVALSGGSFQNRYILKNIENLLAQNNYTVYTNKLVPANDGGIALGQLAIAAKLRSNGKC